MRHFSKLFAASTLAVLGLTVRADDSAQAAPIQAPSATAEPTPPPAPAQAGAPDPKPGSGSLYYEAGKRPEPNRPGESSAPRFTSGVRHHVGAHIRIDGGIGYGSTSTQLPLESGGSADISFTGITPVFGTSLGGAVAQDFILAARFFWCATPNPTASALGQSGTTHDITFSTYGIGPEVVYYFMPANVYLAGTVALTRQHMEAGGTTYQTDAGIGFQLGLGKQWWVGERWGLGVGGQFTYASNSSDGVTLNSWSAAGVLSLSLN